MFKIALVKNVSLIMDALQVCVCVSLDEHFNAHIWIFQVMSGLLLISLHSLSQQLKLNMYIVGRKKKCNE